MRTPSSPTDPSRSQSLRALGLALCVLLNLNRSFRTAAEDRIEYRYEDYKEDAGRVRVHTQTAYFETDLNPKVAVKGQFVYDAISGATPTGGPPAAGDRQVPLVELHDRRYSGNIGADLKYGNTTTTPGFAYSSESDYQSVGISLNEAIDFNQRNTTLNLGIAHNFDRVSGFYQRTPASKDSTDFLVGINQLLTPHTFVTLNLTLGYSMGYLTDPYKGVNFTFSYPVDAYDPASVDVNHEEKRPDHKFRQVVQAGITHFIEKLNGSVEASYRFHHDDWGIFSHTAELDWHQKIGKKLLLSPFFRYYYQTQADFYATRFAGDPLFPDGAKGSLQADGFSILFNDDPTFPGTGTSTFNVPAHPGAYSSDYRLSRLNSFTTGVVLSWKIHENLSVELAYKRYVMQGLDGVTPASAYPSANVYTMGFGLWF